MFHQKFEKLDTDYLTHVDIYSIWNSSRQYEQEDIQSPEKEKSVMVNDQEYELVEKKEEIKVGSQGKLFNAISQFG
jgi:hypothetical protein